MSLIASSLSLSLLLASASLAAPLQGSFSWSAPSRAGSYDLARRGFKAAPPVTGEDFVFDPSYAQAEIRRVLSKYKDAAEIIHNVQLPAHLQDLLHSTHLLSDAISPALEAAFDGAAIQDVAGARQATMPLIDDISGNLDVLYYGPISMGSQNQRMTVDIDTGSADL
ncbi:hypothetical protein M407DRAFT_18985, partial [Tulasnella calospora MUT 4182]